MESNCLGQMTQENPISAVSCIVFTNNTKENILEFLVKHGNISNKIFNSFWR